MVWKSQGTKTIKLAQHERKDRETLTKCAVNALFHHLIPAVLDLGGYVLAEVMRCCREDEKHNTWRNGGHLGSRARQLEYFGAERLKELTDMDHDSDDSDVGGILWDSDDEEKEEGESSGEEESSEEESTEESSEKESSGSEESASSKHNDVVVAGAAATLWMRKLLGRLFVDYKGAKWKVRAVIWRDGDEDLQAEEEAYKE